MEYEFADLVFLDLTFQAIKELVEFKSLIVSAFAGKKKRTLDLSKDSQQAQPVVTTFDPLMMIYTMLNGFLLILRKSSSLPHKKLAVGEIFELLMQFSSELDQDAWIMIFNKFLGMSYSHLFFSAAATQLQGCQTSRRARRCMARPSLSLPTCSSRAPNTPSRNRRRKFR